MRRLSQSLRAAPVLLVSVVMCLVTLVLNATATNVVVGTSEKAGQEPPARAARSAKAVKQAVRVVRVLPAIVQPGSTPAAADSARIAVEARVTPYVAGRPIELQRKVGKRWKRIDKLAMTKYHKSGVVVLDAPPALASQKLRVVASAYRRIPAAVSKSVTGAALPPPTWTDEFSGTEIDAAWSHRMQGYSVDSMRTCSQTGEQAAVLSRGTLALSVMADPTRTDTTCDVDGANYAWRLNGHVGTQGAVSFRYGYAAARIKFQPRRGQHGAFWLQPAARTADEGPARDTGAEIDVVEWFGEDNPGGGLTSFVYHYPDDGRDGVTPQRSGGWVKQLGRFEDDWASRYHVFSVEWTPRTYVFRIDGQETFRTSTGVSGQEQYLILSLLSSDYELSALGGDRFLPQTMNVDWVRVWETGGH